MQRAVVLTLILVLALGFTRVTHADSSSDIQAQIDAHNQQIAALNADIAKYQAQLDTLGKQKSTLQSTISTLTVSQQKISTSLKVTQNQIGSANLKISQLSLAIGDKQSSIVTDRAAVALSLRQMSQGEDDTFVEQLFAADTIADAWRARDEAVQFNLALQGHVLDLAEAKAALAANRDQVQATQDKLVALKTELTTEQHSLVVSKSAQQSLLTQTKNQESTYQQLIATKKAQEVAFEKMLSDLQSQLHAVGAGVAPPVGTGVLSWPYSANFLASCAGKASALKNIYCITQYFGNTPFATANPQVYNGMGHDGVDFGMPVGTPVDAALGGTVLATGNTDVRAPDGRMCYSFGKWVMLTHPNGLATIYAHLSDNTIVSKGQSVTTGELIGYSGMTGYATGPHLHFGVYVASGVQIMNLGKWRGSAGTPCTSAGAVLPVAPPDAYLNPLSYL